MSNERERCSYCGNLATCRGAYEGAEDESYACDDCCGHGCEDGKCMPLYANADD